MLQYSVMIALKGHANFHEYPIKTVREGTILNLTQARVFPPFCYDFRALIFMSLQIP